MGYDPFSPICEAPLNVLCVPAARIPLDHFEQCMTALRSCSVVGLRGVKRELEASNATASLNFLDGSVLLNIGSSFDTDTAEGRYPVTLNREPQVVLGIVNSEDILSTSASEYQDKLQAIKTDFLEYANRSHHAIVSAIVVFGGVSPAVSDDCLWVDMEGSGPALPDMLSRVVAVVYQQSSIFLQALKNRLASEAPRQSISSTRDGPELPETESQTNSSNRESSATTNKQQSLVVNQGKEETARFLLLQGVLSIQIGQWPDALRQLSEGVSSIRGHSNYLWHAKGLESLLTCMLMLLWAHVDFTIPQICYPAPDKTSSFFGSKSMSAIIASNRASSTSLFSSTSSSPIHGLTELIPHLITTILGLYEKASSILEDSAIDFALSEARVRWANLLLILKNNGCFLQDAALQYIVEGNSSVSQARTTVSSTSSLNLQKNALCQLLIQAALEAQFKLSIQDAATIHIAVAQAFSRLRLERKQGFYLKEFLQRLGPALAEARRLGAVEVGLHPASNSSSSVTSGKQIIPESSNGVRALLDVVARVYGLPSQEKDSNGETKSASERLLQALNFWSTTQASGDLFMKLEILSLCTEISDAISEPKDSLYFTSNLLQAAKKTVTIASGISDASPLLASSDQARLLQNMQRAVNMSEKLGLSDVRAEYWDKFLVRNMELLEDTHTNRLMPHSPKDLSLAAVTDGQMKKDPFIFNPFAKAKSTNSLSVVSVGELAKFGVVLQNPLDVEVEIEDIVLSSEGCEFRPSHHSILLGPLCCQVFTLSGMPEAEGELKITGCTATIRGCHKEEFLVLPDDWKLPIDIKKRMRSNAPVASSSIMAPKAKEIALKVTRSLPSLSIISSSLLQPSLMLLEGESKVLELTVRNDSSIGIDFVLLTFQDTVKKRLEEALINKELSPADTHEIQYQIASRPAVVWVNAKSDLMIPPQGTEKFALEIFGQPGLTDVTVMIDYAYLRKAREEVADTFYTRQLSYSITTTINGSVDVPRCLILPLQGDLYWSHNPSAKEYVESRLFSEILQNGKQNEQCILLLDVRNIWPQPLEIDFEARELPYADAIENEGWKDAYAVSEVLQPGQMSRILLLVPRIYIADPGASIPSLDTKRQFVVSASKLSIDAEAASRESFWYRERLLQCLRATWKEQNGNRKGVLDMRKSIRLSSRMIDALRIDTVEVSFTLRPSILRDNNKSSEDAIQQTGESNFTLRRNTFATLVTTIHNRSNEDLRLLLRLQPSLRNQPHNVALDLSKRFAWSGVLQNALHPIMKPGEMREVELGVIALVAGEYDINATVEEIRGCGVQKVLPPDVSATSERRIWHARHPCLIDTVNEDVLLRYILK